MSATGLCNKRIWCLKSTEAQNSFNPINGGSTVIGAEDILVLKACRPTDKLDPWKGVPRYQRQYISGVSEYTIVFTVELSGISENVVESTQYVQILIMTSPNYRVIHVQNHSIWCRGGLKF